jgi:hypothetical protein
MPRIEILGSPLVGLLYLQCTSHLLKFCSSDTNTKMNTFRLSFLAMICVTHMCIKMIQGAICFVATRVIACVIAVNFLGPSSGAFDIFGIGSTRSPLSGNSRCSVSRSRCVRGSVQGLGRNTCDYIVRLRKWSIIRFPLDVTIVIRMHRN